MKIHRFLGKKAGFRYLKVLEGEENWEQLLAAFARGEHPAENGGQLKLTWESPTRRLADFFWPASDSLIGITHDLARSEIVWSKLAAMGKMLPIQVEGYGEAFLYRPNLRVDGEVVTHKQRGREIVDSVKANLSEVPKDTLFCVTGHEDMIFLKDDNEAFIGSLVQRISIDELFGFSLELVNGVE